MNALESVQCSSENRQKRLTGIFSSLTLICLPGVLCLSGEPFAFSFFYFSFSDRALSIARRLFNTPALPWQSSTALVEPAFNVFLSGEMPLTIVFV